MMFLDFYDDPNGSLLKKTFASPEELPEIIKQAHILNSEEREVLRDDAYALVLVNEGKVMRKFACVDAGNTALSAIYFLENHDRLPEEAVKVAAANIAEACQLFGVPGTDRLTKLAAAHGYARKRDPMQGAIVGDESDWAARTNLISTQAGSDAGRVIPTANSMKTAGVLGQMMQPSGQTDMFGQPAIKGVLGVMKDRRAARMAAPQAPTVPKVASAQRVVDITGKSSEIRMEKRASQETALDGRYGLDSYSDVQKAVEYFSDYWPVMDPADRHEYAVKTASRANALGIEVPDILGRYGSTGYAPDVDAHVVSRRMHAPHEWAPVYNELLEKRASTDPAVFAQELEKVDEESGLSYYWGGHIADPYLSTFGGGFKKEAGVWDWMSRTGEYITEDQIRNLAVNGRPGLKKHLKDKTADEFCDKPIETFEKMTEAQKMIVLRLATVINMGPIIV